MNEDAIAFTLEYSEAIEMDELFLINKSFKKQTEVLCVLDQKLKSQPEYNDRVLYYVNTLLDELYESKQFDTIDKYLKFLSKTDNILDICTVFVKVLYTVRHNIASYEPFKREFVSKCIKSNIDYENALKGYIDAN